MYNKFLSIIIPIYNAEKFLHKCIKSIITQTFEDWECILVDDGSIDSSPQICDAYAEQDDRIIVIHKQNGGVSSARNIGLSVANGKYITFCDSDDFFLPDAFSSFVNVTNLYPDCQIYIGGWQSYKDCLGKIKVDKISPRLACKKGPFLAEYFIRSLWRCFIEKSLIDFNKIQFLEGLSFSEDASFLCECSLYCTKYCMFPDVIYTYYYNNDSATRGNFFDMQKKINNQYMAVNEINRIIHLAKKQKRDRIIVYYLKLEKKRCLNWVLSMLYGVRFSNESIKYALIPIFKNNLLMSKEGIYILPRIIINWIRYNLLYNIF